MKLNEREVTELHEMALIEAAMQERQHTTSLINAIYGLHVWFLVRMIQWLRHVSR